MNRSGPRPRPEHRPEPEVNKITALTLPVKITGIVFWGMVLVGLLAASYMLKQKEVQLINEYKNNILYVEHELETVYTVHYAHIYDSEYMSLQIEAFFSEISQKFPLEAIRFKFAGHVYQFGKIGGQQERIKGRLLIRILGAGNNNIVDLEVFMKGLDKTITESRKQMMLVIGALVFVFGMILQQILQKVLSRPILDMVLSAQNFTRGDQTARFNENRNDELGYLSKFVNQALDSILEHQQELEESRRELYEEKMRAEVTLHSIMDGVITTDANHVIQYLNPVAELLVGIDSEQTKNRLLGDILYLVNEETGVSISSPARECLESRRVEVLENNAALIRSDGKVIPIEASAAPMRSDSGEVIGVVMVFQDVSHERKLSRQLSHQASHDMLTGLYNRRMFEEQLNAALQNIKAEKRQHALCYVDLDQFKIVNDTCGHMAGDELLRQLGDLLKSCIREGDVLARLGGDEFGLLLQNCELKQATHVAEKVRRSVKAFRFAWQDKKFEIGASIGVVGVNADNTDLSALLASADMACYVAKDMGRNRVHVYEPTDAMMAERHGQMHWAGRIRHALEEHRMVLYEQPVVGIKSENQHESHCEVLIRMHDEGCSVVSPDAFIPAAERYNLMPEIDRWVISRVFKQVNTDCCLGNSQLVAINLSGTSLADESLLPHILEEANKYGVDLNRICFEVTETAAISNLSRATHFMSEMKLKGCRFSLDDFGSGLSSFTYLKNLRYD